MLVFGLRQTSLVPSAHVLRNINYLSRFLNLMFLRCLGAAVPLLWKPGGLPTVAASMIHLCPSLIKQVLWTRSTQHTHMLVKNISFSYSTLR